MEKFYQDATEIEMKHDPALQVSFIGHNYLVLNIQSTLVISKSKGPAETLRDIRNSTYQMCRIEENTKRTTKFHK